MSKQRGLKFDKLGDGHYWAVRAGVGYEVRRTDYGYFEAKIFDPHDGAYEETHGKFDRISEAQACLREIAAATFETDNA